MSVELHAADPVKTLEEMKMEEAADARALNSAVDEHDESAAAGREPQGEEGGEAEQRAPLRYGRPDDDDFEERMEAFEQRVVKKDKPFNGDLSELRNTTGRWAEEPEGEGEAEGDQPAGEPAAAKTPDPASAPKKTFTVTIRGETMEVDEEAYHRAAQKGLAGDDYLAETKRILEEAKALARSGKVETEAERAEAERTLSEEGKNSRRKAIEAIQYGSTEEAERAFADLERRAADTARQTLMIEARDRAFEADLEAGRVQALEKHPGLKNPILAQTVEVGVGSLTAEMMAKFVENMDPHNRELMERADYSPDKLRRMDPTTAVRTYREMHRVGWQVPPISQAYDAVASYLATTLQHPAGAAGGEQQIAPSARGNTPANEDQGRERVAISPERAARREAAVQQPNRAGSVGRSSQPARRVTPEQDAKDYFREESERPPGVPVRRR